MVMIERSKQNKDRRVPVTWDLAGLLARFDHLADLRHPDREWFFEDKHGRQYSPGWLIAGYHLCCERAGGIAPASTPYTLRHNYATRTLTRWVEEGKDLEAWLPYLAAYMGHQKYSSTAWYVHLLPGRLAATGLTSAAGIIPAVISCPASAARPGTRSPRAATPGTCSWATPPSTTTSQSRRSRSP
jgi:integrase/recombinase XerD